MRTVWLLVFCSFAPLVAAENKIEKQELETLWDEEEGKPQYQPTDVTTLFYKTVLLVVFLSGSIIAGGWLLKSISGSKFTSLTNGGAIELIERKHISPKTAIWLAKIENTPIVIVESVHGVAVHTLNTTSETS